MVGGDSNSINPSRSPIPEPQLKDGSDTSLTTVGSPTAPTALDLRGSNGSTPDTWRLHRDLHIRLLSGRFGAGSCELVFTAVEWDFDLLSGLIGDGSSCSFHFLRNKPASIPSNSSRNSRSYKDVKFINRKTGIVHGWLFPVGSWAPNIDSQSIASQLFAVSLFPYSGFLYFITKSKSAAKLTLFGFHFLLAFVGATSENKGKREPKQRLESTRIGAREFERNRDDLHIDRKRGSKTSVHITVVASANAVDFEPEDDDLMNEDAAGDASPQAAMPKLTSAITGGASTSLSGPKKTKGRGFRDEDADRQSRVASRGFESLSTDGGLGPQRSIEGWIILVCGVHE
ncbi:alcohol dehydrogenase 1 [Hibiscus syriacus]|uniref:Alcohol dehydrogenase 1 n=1 Tax=Hibiscus syriacus TaxID=106335 RepID=A0A6A3CZW5_HIBSY|nr:alcohol dehydrogenase 1 [Hibiscus syriacus]